MKPERNKNPQQRDPHAAGGTDRNVDPDQPFPQDPVPSEGGDGGDDRDLEQAYADKKHGEGDYQGAKDYGKRVRSFVRSGQVDRAAEEAPPRDPSEARELTDAEEEGRSRSKGEDPQLHGGARKRSDQNR